MSLQINKIIRWVLVTIVVFLIVVAALEVKIQPKFTYQIKTYEITQDLKEQPMEVTIMPQKQGLSFKVIFTDDRGNSEKAKLVIANSVESKPPFLTYGDTLTVQLVNADQIAKEDQVVYEVSGEITKLRTGQYKLKVIDPNSNLVDERVVTVE